MEQVDVPAAVEATSAHASTSGDEGTEERQPATASSIPDTPSPSTSPETPTARKSVTFENIHIQEYYMTLGDHPGVSSGPPVSLGWNTGDLHVLSLDEYESGVDSRRRGQELRLPVGVRRKILAAADHSKQEMRKAQDDARRAQLRRNYSVATEDFVLMQTMFESLGRKYKRWRHKKKGLPMEPAEVWLAENKQGTQSDIFDRKAKTFHGVSEDVLDAFEEAAPTTMKRSQSTPAFLHG
jgi:hypothetical protein